ncbi:predicted protein [Histoplasma capsulatum G186AR]|uniref:Uncharacterized protein n=1 Tax=Ajellomyces capsulatus (strain G186AR / H82 / ATCC MYA-2454 / RMSCC 2432) TaxID=447093 RepID=C0P0Z8_AJECG|nr:uncharacterized protein HCBG_09078 [Histoplasma capsulatum G186AR]EEH02634.1 predicted protein [Histoplasma capsulatum G186AR]
MRLEKIKLKMKLKMRLKIEEVGVEAEVVDCYITLHPRVSRAAPRPVASDVLWGNPGYVRGNSGGISCLAAANGVTSETAYYMYVIGGSGYGVFEPDPHNNQVICRGAVTQPSTPLHITWLLLLNDLLDFTPTKELLVPGTV